MDIPLLSDIVVILGLSVIVIFLFNKLKLPTVLGFLITGILAGPNMFSLITAVHDVDILAEVGIVLLLFTIGIEFSLAELSLIKKAVLVGGAVQVLLTIAGVFFLTSWLGLSKSEAVFAGFLISLSSTAIILKLLQEKGELDTPHGKSILGILIFQDIIVVPMMLVTPLLSGKSGDIFYPILILIIKGIVVLGIVYVMAKYLMPKILYQVAKTNSKEIFLLAVVVICFAVAWITNWIGLSLSLGAFLAGIIISESEYSHQAVSYILPFREIFESFFFVSIGMLLDVRFLFEHIGVILLITVSVIILKALFSGIAASMLRFSLRTVILTSLALCQVGEFAFILSKVGISEGIIDSSIYQYFLSVSIVTMGVTPLIINFAHNITDVILKIPIHQRIHNFFSYNSNLLLPNKRTFKNHLVIIGYGFNGQNLARAARYAVIPYVVVDMNIDRVKKEIKNENIFYGDAVYEDILKQVWVEKARVAAIGISDPVATRRIVANIRMLSETIHIIVRTRYIQEITELKRLGANEVIAEEFESSIEIFARVLSKYMIPQDEIESFIRVIRSDEYEMLRPMPEKKNILDDIQLNLHDIDISAVKIRQPSTIIGQTLEELDLRSRYGITLLSIKRDKEYINNPPGDTKLLERDILFMFGEPEKIINFNKKVCG